MSRLFGLILLIIPLFFIYVVFKGAVELPETQKRLKDAPFIEDGEVHPEYNGQLAIVCGTLRSESNAYDYDLGLTMPSVCASRSVEMLKRSTDEDGHTCLKWVPISAYQEDEWLRGTVLGENLYLDSYRIDDELIRMIAPGKEVTFDMLDGQELNTLMQHNLEMVTYSGVCYISEAPSNCFKEPCYMMGYESFRRVHYRTMVPGREQQYAIAGIVREDRISKDDSLDTQPIYEGAASKKDVVTGNAVSSILGMVVVLIICVLSILYIFSRFMA